TKNSQPAPVTLQTASVYVSRAILPVATQSCPDTFLRRLMPPLSVPRVLPMFALVASLAWTSTVHAQESPNLAAPAHVAYVEGTVTLERDGALEAAIANMPIVAGDRLRTTVGRIELLFPDGS